MRAPTDKAYYMTATPTLLLEMLRAAFEKGFPPDIRSDREYVQVQKDVSALLCRVLLGVGPDYTGPYLAKKFVYEWSKGCAMCFGDTLVSEWQDASADKGGLLDSLPQDMPLSVLANRLGVPAPLCAVYH
jgi:hypothetical protein